LWAFQGATAHKVIRQQVSVYLKDKSQLEICRQATWVYTIQEEKVDLIERFRVIFNERDAFRDMVR